MSEKFLKAAEEVKKLSLRQTKDAQYELYGLYKQVTDGDCTTRKPSVMMHMVQMKWKAWNKLRGLSKEEAEAEYIALVESLKSKE